MTACDVAILRTENPSPPIDNNHSSFRQQLKSYMSSTYKNVIIKILAYQYVSMHVYACNSYNSYMCM